MTVWIVIMLAGCAASLPWEGRDIHTLYEDEVVMIFSMPSRAFFPLLYTGGELDTRAAMLPEGFFQSLSRIAGDYYLGDMDFSFVSSFPVAWQGALLRGVREEGNATLYYKKRDQGPFSFTIYAPDKRSQLSKMQGVSAHLQSAVVAHQDYESAGYFELGYLAPVKGEMLPFGVVALVRDNNTTFFWDNRPEVGISSK